MEQTPCEHMIWNGLPVIRKELAKSMISNYGLTQRQAAEKLGITPSAVCQYLAHKRAKTNMIDNHILSEINVSAKRIIENGSTSVIPETCRLCKLLRQQGILTAKALE
jgi:predicted transcriptional regulator